MKVLWFRASFPCLQSAITGNFHNFNATITYHYATTSLRWVVYSCALFMCKLGYSVANSGFRFSMKLFRDVGIPEIFLRKDILFTRFDGLIFLPRTFWKGVNFAFSLTPDLPFCMRGYDVNKKTLKYFDELDSVLQSLVKCYRVQQHCMNFCKNVYKQSILYD